MTHRPAAGPLGRTQRLHTGGDDNLAERETSRHLDGCGGETRYFYRAERNFLGGRIDDPDGRLTRRAGQRAGRYPNCLGAAKCCLTSDRGTQTHLDGRINQSHAHLKRASRRIRARCNFAHATFRSRSGRHGQSHQDFRVRRARIEGRSGDVENGILAFIASHLHDHTTRRGDFAGLDANRRDDAWRIGSSNCVVKPAACNADLRLCSIGRSLRRSQRLFGSIDRCSSHNMSIE